MERESRVVEYKREVHDLRSVARTVVAFANGDGGRIVIGVEDKTRSAVGLPVAQIEQLLERLPVSLADQIQPPVFPQVYERTVDGRELLVVQVFPGGQKPYFIAAEGIQRGVYIRVGAHTRRAEGEVLEELQLLRSRLGYDESPMSDCPLKQLDTSVLAPPLRTEKGLLSLGAARRDPFSGALVPTRGGILMLHPAPERYIAEAVTIVSRMRGDKGRDTVKSVDVTGSLPSQSAEVLTILAEWLGRNPRVEGNRYADKDSRLPMDAVREAVNNALFHRQYSINGATKVALYADRLEVFSPGHFAGPFLPEALGDGTSYIRNRVVCLIARGLHLIEKRGTGIRLIQDSMAGSGHNAPRFEEGPNWFKVTLHTQRSSSEGGKPDPGATVMGLLEDEAKITSATVMRALGVSKATAVSHIQRLIADGRLVREGKGPKTVYRTVGR